MSAGNKPVPAPRYDGYRSFQYLDGGADYRAFRLADQLERVPAYDNRLDDEQLERVHRLLADNLVVSLHDHPQVFPADMSQTVEYSHSGRLPFGFEGLAHSRLDVVFDNLAGPTGCITSHYGWAWGDVVYDIGHRLCDIAHQNFARVALNLEDLFAYGERGQLAVVLGIEAATPIENDLNRLDLLYGFGVRQVGIVYNESNLLGSGLKEPRDGGLTRFGQRAVERMNKLGISIDLSHAGDRTSLDTIAASSAPVMITHAGARAVWPSERMKPDVVLRALAAAGGLLGIEAAPHSTVSPGHRRHSIDSVMEHFEYCVGLMGIEHVTFGPDTIYGDHAGLHEALAPVFNTGPAREPRGEPDALTRIDVEGVTPERVPYVAGMENPTENFFNVVAWLVRHGYSDDEIALVIGGNTVRVLRETW